MAKSFFGIFRSANQDDPLASVKSVQAWAAGLPAKDPVGALGAIVRVLENMGTTQPEVTSNRVLALMAMDRLSLPIQAEVLLQYRLPAMSGEVRRRLWHTCNDLARWFAHAYEHVGDNAGAQAEGTGPRLQDHGIFSRMFYYRGLQAKLGLFHYESWIPGSWKFLHNLYREARAQVDRLGIGNQVAVRLKRCAGKVSTLARSENFIHHALSVERRAEQI